MTLLGENRFCVTFPKLDVTRHVTRRHRRTRRAPGHISCSPTTFSVMARLSKQQRHLAKARAQLAEGRATGKENCTPSSLSTRSPPRFSKTALSPHKSKKKHDVADSNYIAELCKENLLLRRREKRHKEQIADLKRKRFRLRLRRRGLPQSGQYVMQSKPRQNSQINLPGRNSDCLTLKKPVLQRLMQLPKNSRLSDTVYEP
ncbi:hypothetical protein B0H10DRAFT_2201445 [Mycena sp. CBHHK59/15]|nr:hypothetical protein B0H10DRAFT_2201445 [Mycena sp. CBHHK59/15]